MNNNNKQLSRDDVVCVLISQSSANNAGRCQKKWKKCRRTMTPRDSELGTVNHDFLRTVHLQHNIIIHHLLCKISSPKQCWNLVTIL